MKCIKQLWNWLIGGSNKYEDFQSRYPSDIIKEELNEDSIDELEEYAKLQTQKYQAIAKCDGCESQVFVLKIDGIEVGYYPTLGKLASENGLVRQAVYTYWNKTNKENTPLFKGKYEIIKYTTNEENHI